VFGARTRAPPSSCCRLQGTSSCRSRYSLLRGRSPRRRPPPPPRRRHLHAPRPRAPTRSWSTRSSATTTNTATIYTSRTWAACVRHRTAAARTSPGASPSRSTSFPFDRVALRSKCRAILGTETSVPCAFKQEASTQCAYSCQPTTCASLPMLPWYRCRSSAYRCFQPRPS